MRKSGRSAATPKKQSEPRVREGIVRRSVSLDRNVEALAHELVGGENFSAFVNEAVRIVANRIALPTRARSVNAQSIC
jgi:hypothetical protein